MTPAWTRTLPAAGAPWSFPAGVDAARSAAHDTTILLLGASKLIVFWLLSCAVA